MRTMCFASQNHGPYHMNQLVLTVHHLTRRFCNPFWIWLKSIKNGLTITYRWCYILVMTNNNKIKNPYKKTDSFVLQERKSQILDSIPALDNIIRSSLITRFIKCGKSNCRCVGGEGHKSLYLSSYYHGHTYLDYVPKPYVEKVSQYINDYETASSLLAELSEINLELFRRKELEA